MALLLWGCDTTAAVPAKPKVVRKKIVAPKGNTAKVSTRKTVRTVIKKPAGKPQTKTVVAKVDQTQADVKNQPAVKKNTDARTLIANNEKIKPVPSILPGKKSVVKPVPSILPGKKSAVKPVIGNQSSLVKQKKPAISPKSEITEIKQAAIKQTQPAGSKTVAGKKMNTAEPAATNAPRALAAGNMPPLYDPKGKIDPFEPLVREMPTSAKKKKNIKRQPRTPLERIALSQLKLTAIIMASSGNRALVEETSGKGYVVKKGTYIGINGGKISNIKKEIVIVEERFEDFSGKIQTRERELKLPKPPGEF
jgi:type IV pilus assembly protein PilP